MIIAWSTLWWWWLATIAVSFLLIEGASILRAPRQAWSELTLSDCIRRWSSARHWLPPIVWGASVLLLVHWFGSP